MRQQTLKGLFIGLLTLLCLRLGTTHAAGVVTTCDEASLRAALAGGGTVTFSCDGTIALAKTLVIDANTTLDATGHSITLSGKSGYNYVQVLKINAGIQCNLTNLVITDGFANVDGSSVPGGGGVFNDGGIMHLTHCVLSNNAADPFNNDPAIALALGGGLLNQGGRVTLDNCVFSGNGSGGYSYGNVGRGGGLYNDGGSAVLHNCAFTGNAAAGLLSSGALDDPATGALPVQGGALANHKGSVALLNCAFYQNTATGGAGLMGDGPGPGNGDGSQGQGGAIYTEGGSINSTNCTFASNQAVGGAGAHGDPDTGNRDLNGGNGADGLGGAICNTAGTETLTNCTLANNNVAGGAGGEGDTNFWRQGSGGVGGSGHGGGMAVVTGNVILHNTILDGNSDVNVYGTIGDRGHNLSSDATPRLGPSSRNNTFSLLVPLADNGGPTQTIGLYPYSAAIDAADNSACPATDQRGVARPQGKGCDIGAFEGTVADTIAPTVRITLPADKAARSNLNAIRGTAADNSGPGGVARVVVFIQCNSDKKYWTGTTWGAMTPLSTILTNNATQWARLSSNPTGANLIDGLYTIQARAYDLSGNQSALATTTTRIDQTAPSVTITTPMQGASLVVLPVLRGTAADNSGGSGINRVELLLQRSSDHQYWTGQAWSATATILPVVYKAGKWSRYDQLTGGGDVADLANCQYLIIARAYDQAGNVSRAQVTVTVKRPVATPKPNDTATLSSTRLSTAKVNRATNSIQLFFNGDLDPDAASDPSSYTLQSNGHEIVIESASYANQRHLVSLSVAAGVLAEGAQVLTQWHGLRDGQGRNLAAGKVMVK